MSKSYWMEEQKGNFSNDQEDTFDPKKRYVGVRLQQGVPLLDRDWNELEDIRRYEDMALRKQYIGNGSPDDGFKISAADPPANDFKILKGRCMVGGLEAVNAPESGSYILYSDQSDTGISPPASDRVDTVYLDVWIKEVRSKIYPEDSPDIEIDTDLANSKDVNVETCIRHKLEWRIRVDEGSDGYTEEAYHYYYDIAKITRKAGRDIILDEDIQDLREVAGKRALDLSNSKFRDIINSILKGNLPSEPEVKIAEVELGAGTYFNFKDRAGNIWLFYNNATNNSNIWCRRYSASAGVWGEETQMTTGTTYKYPFVAFEDNNGNIWLFWYDFGDHNNIWCKRYSAGGWEEETQLTTGTTSKSFLKTLEDKAGNIWLFWNNWDTNTSYNIRCKKYSAGSWEEEETQLTTGTTYQHYRYSFEDKAGNIWLFWADSGDYNNIWCKFYNSDNKTWGNNNKLTAGTTSKSPLKAFEDKAGNIWLFWYNRDANNIYNIWCKRYSAGSWVENQLTYGTTSQNYYNCFEDKAGNIWLFWYNSGNNNNIWCKKYSTSWGPETQVTNSTVYGYNYNLFEDHAGDIWLFWTTYVNGGDNLWCKMYCARGWWGMNTQLITNTSANYIKSFEDSKGNVWVLFGVPDYSNIWCRRYIDGDWLTEMRLTSGTTNKIYLNHFEDNEGNILLFWQAYQDWAVYLDLPVYEDEPVYNFSIWFKKCYASI